MCIREPPAVACEAVDVRRLHLCRFVAAHVAVTEVIGKDEDNVGPLIRSKRADSNEVSEEEDGEKVYGVMSLDLPGERRFRGFRADFRSETDVYASPASALLPVPPSVQ